MSKELFLITIFLIDFQIFRMSSISILDLRQSLRLELARQPRLLAQYIADAGFAIHSKICCTLRQGGGRQYQVHVERQALKDSDMGGRLQLHQVGRGFREDDQHKRLVWSPQEGCQE